jgi:hypothetical protein
MKNQRESLDKNCWGKTAILSLASREGLPTDVAVFVEPLFIIKNGLSTVKVKLEHERGLCVSKR